MARYLLMLTSSLVVEKRRYLILANYDIDIINSQGQVVFVDLFPGAGNRSSYCLDEIGREKAILFFRRTAENSVDKFKKGYKTIVFVTDESDMEEIIKEGGIKQIEDRLPQDIFDQIDVVANDAVENLSSGKTENITFYACEINKEDGGRFLHHPVTLDKVPGLLEYIFAV